VDDLRSFRVPDEVSTAFVACFSQLPGIDAFAPNARLPDSAAQLARFSAAAALALLCLLRRHSPELLAELLCTEAALKGAGGCVARPSCSISARCLPYIACIRMPLTRKLACADVTLRTCVWRT
jgi:hypothetical protein